MILLLNNFNPNFDPDFRSEGGLDPLLALQASVPQQLGDGFTTPILNFDAQNSHFHLWNMYL